MRVSVDGRLMHHCNAEACLSALKGSPYSRLQAAKFGAPSAIAYPRLVKSGQPSINWATVGNKTAIATSPYVIHALSPSMLDADHHALPLTIRFLPCTNRVPRSDAYCCWRVFIQQSQPPVMSLAPKMVTTQWSTAQVGYHMCLQSCLSGEGNPACRCGIGMLMQRMAMHCLSTAIFNHPSLGPYPPVM